MERQAQGGEGQENDDPTQALHFKPNLQLKEQVERAKEQQDAKAGEGEGEEEEGEGEPMDVQEDEGREEGEEEEGAPKPEGDEGTAADTLQSYEDNSDMYAGLEVSVPGDTEGGEEEGEEGELPSAHSSTPGLDLAEREAEGEGLPFTLDPNPASASAEGPGEAGEETVGEGGGESQAEASLESPSKGKEPGGKYEPSRHLWVNNLGPGATEDKLRETFGAHGPLEAVRILRRAPNNLVGFVHFAKTEDALAAKEKLDGTFFRYGGPNPHYPVRIQFQTRGNNVPVPTLRVHNIAPQGRVSRAPVAATVCVGDAKARVVDVVH
jgi:hypothetical protein